jgi:hypothetical protein
MFRIQSGQAGLEPLVCAVDVHRRRKRAGFPRHRGGCRVADSGRVAHAGSVVITSSEAMTAAVVVMCRWAQCCSAISAQIAAARSHTRLPNSGAERHDHLIPQVGHASAVWTAGEAGPRRRWTARHT